MMNRFRRKFQELQSKGPDQTDPTPSLRDFKELSEREQKLKKLILTKERRRRRLLYGLLFTLVIAVWSFIALKFYGGDHATEDGERGPLFGETIGTASFFQAFIRSNFGEQDPERLNTIRVSGAIEKDGSEQQFVLYKKQPDMALLNLTYEEWGTVTLGMDGNTVWQKIEARAGTTKVDLVKGETAEQIKEIGNFFTPFVQYALTFNGLDPAFKIEDQREEEGLIKVSFTNPFTDQESVAEVDGRTLHLLRITSLNETREASEASYSEYKPLNGFQIPRRIDYYKDGKLEQSIRIDKAAINTGILSEVFTTPSQIGGSPEPQT